jgi:membrane protein YqaA with SNARE-associated domain
MRDDNFNHGAWIGALLLLLAFVTGCACGYLFGLRVERVSHRREVRAVEAERDAARRDADAFFLALKLIGEGGQLTEMAAIGRPSKGN